MWFLHILGMGGSHQPTPEDGNLRQAENATSISHPLLRLEPSRPREASASGSRPGVMRDLPQSCSHSRTWPRVLISQPLRRSRRRYKDFAPRGPRDRAGLRGRGRPDVIHLPRDPPSCYLRPLGGIFSAGDLSICPLGPRALGAQEASVSLAFPVT